jgi:hypothetical protein
MPTNILNISKRYIPYMYTYITLSLSLSLSLIYIYLIAYSIYRIKYRLNYNFLESKGYIYYNRFLLIRPQRVSILRFFSPKILPANKSNKIPTLHNIYQMATSFPRLEGKVAFRSNTYRRRSLLAPFFISPCGYSRRPHPGHLAGPVSCDYRRRAASKSLRSIYDHRLADSRTFFPPLACG